jgi:hypothetical protein
MGSTAFTFASLSPFGAKECGLTGLLSFYAAGKVGLFSCPAGRRTWRRKFAPQTSQPFGIFDRHEEQVLVNRHVAHPDAAF